MINMDILDQALAAHRQGNLAEAIEGYQQCILEAPTEAAYTNLGVALRSQGKIEAALVAYQRALEINPEHVPALSNWGGGLRALGRLTEAVPVLKQAIGLQPDFAAAHYNLGLVYMDAGQPEKAIHHFDEALHLEPERVDAQFDRAVCLLQSGDFQAGFQAYECRFAYEPRLQRYYSQPRWQGEALSPGQTLLLYCEQGFGDTLQFIRYVALIEKNGGHIILECPLPLKRLMQTVENIDQVIVPGEPLPAFDTHASLLSLPAHLNTTLETVPKQLPYLKAPEPQKRLPASQHLRIGLVWASGHADVGVRHRSIPLKVFEPLLALAGHTFYSFQKGPAVAQLEETGLGSLIHNLDDAIQDFSDTAAFLSQMDLLISADTAIVHLAGALNIPCWVLLPSGSEWRWLLNRSDTPWYDSVRLFRKAYEQPWPEVIQEVIQALCKPQNQAEAVLEPTPVNPTLFFHPEGFSTSGHKLMGRQAAGESFLKAWCQHSGFDQVKGYGLSLAHGKAFAGQVQQFSQNTRSVQWTGANGFQNLSESGCLMIPGPGLAEFAWQRRTYRANAYSLCGITHTTASDRVMDSLGELLTAPTQPWDALICTSHSVKAMVKQVITEYQAYLSERFQNASIQCPVQLPVIPLGLDVAAFKPTEAKRFRGKQFRQALNIPEASTVFLFMGRLSFHAKAHPYPMLVALEAAAQQTGKPVSLILAGWFANTNIEQSFRQAAKQLCPSVQVLFVDGRQPAVRESIWYASDVFTSLSDNIQETFGLTPLEAKAAGLPVVVSNWDGYRETVRDELDGFLIPTWMPEAGMGKELADRYMTQQDSYDVYIGKTSQSVAVDIEACTQAYVRLIEDPALRVQLGAQGQADVQARFDWPVIFKAYQGLWQELTAIRKPAPGPFDGAEAPLRQDPYRLFASYPSQHLHPETVVQTINRARLSELQSLSMTQVAQTELASLDQINQWLNSLEQQESQKLKTLQQQTPELSSAQFYRTIGWLAKFGVLTLAHTEQKHDYQISSLNWL